jgi:transposase-like protein
MSANELINAEKGVGIKKCPGCKSVKISSATNEKGFFLYWCSRCDKQFIGKKRSLSSAAERSLTI